MIEVLLSLLLMYIQNECSYYMNQIFYKKLLEKLKRLSISSTFLQRLSSISAGHYHLIIIMYHVM